MKLQYKQSLLAALIFCGGMYVGGKVYKNMQPQPTDPNAKINEIIRLVKANYVDNVNIDSIAAILQTDKTKINDSLEKAAIQTLLQHLDPHSVYLPPTILKSANEEMKGEFAGIGVEYMDYKDTIYITHIIKDGPADKAQLAIGDKILKVNDSIVSGVQLSNTRLRAMLRGSTNSKVNVTLLKSDGETKTATINRGVISLPALDAQYMVDKTVGYIKLNKFSLNSHEEVSAAIASLKKQGMQSLIFDLRDNPGGSLSDAVNIVDEFVAGKELVTYTNGVKKTKESYYTKFEGQFEKGKLVVLIDEGSASASEVVAGALQDLDRATIIGRRSFGKGLVQQQFSLPDKSAIRLTIARYYTSSGRSIQKDYSKGKKAYEDDIHNRFKNNSLVVADSNIVDKSKMYKTKAGKTVYGGGGVMPDIFVALDTINNFPTVYSQLIAKSIPTNFAALWYFKNKNSMTNFKTAAEFGNTFIFSSTDWALFENICKENAIDIKKLTTVQKQHLQNQLIPLIARQHWRNTGYFEVLNLKDNAIKKALETLK